MGTQKISLKSGVVYGEPGRGEVQIGKRLKWLPILARILSLGGLVMMAVAVVGIVGIYIPLGMAEVRYAWMQSDLGRLVHQTQRSFAANSQNKAVALAVQPTWDVPDVNYSINIPKIGAVSKVIPNVDAGNPTLYLAALSKGVAEAAGLSHPGEMGTTFLFAHSVGSRVDYARFNAVFYLLDKVENGDEIDIMYQQKLYKYEVVNKEILAAADTRYLVPQNQTEKLVLQTCYPPGTSWKRLVVTAKRVY